MEKINVAIYGGDNIFGGRPVKAEAEILYCEKCEKCDIYKRGRCVNGRKFMGLKRYCPFGKVEIVEGYTKRAAKYAPFMSKWRSDEKYHNITPSDTDTRVAYIDDMVYINIPFIHYDKETQRITRDGMGVHEPIMISKEQFTVDFIREIMNFVPRTLFDNVPIKDYKVRLAEFIYQLKKYYPDKYEELIQTVPEYKDITFDYVGKKAYMLTLADGCRITDSNRNELILSVKDKTLTCENYKLQTKSFDSMQGKMVFTVSEDTVYKITDNSQVCETTRFVDE